MSIQQSTMFILQCALFVLHIEALFKFLLYIKSIIVLLMPLLIIV